MTSWKNNEMLVEAVRRSFKGKIPPNLTSTMLRTPEQLKADVRYVLNELNILGADYRYEYPKIKTMGNRNFLRKLISLNSNIKQPFSYPKHVRNESKDISSNFIFSYDTGGLYVSLELSKSLIPVEIGQAHFDILTLDRLMDGIERTHIPTDDEDADDF